ncbi:hypothetical protein [Kineococcus sp. G2]|uniref:hypothetical protein n=1 Tax=Kineococcus sp. G2 TaxID=3127484 RepID=UPI00301E124B
MQTVESERLRLRRWTADDADSALGVRLLDRLERRVTQHEDHPVSIHHLPLPEPLAAAHRLGFDQGDPVTAGHPS